MMQITPAQIAKIKALADDVRGDPNTRAIAQAKLDKYRREHPDVFETRDDLIAKIRRAVEAKNPPNPRMRQGDDYAKWRFMDMGNWAKTDKGNYRIEVAHKNFTYRIVVFSKNGFSWVRSGADIDIDPTWSRTKFVNRREAMDNAWASLQSI